MLWLWHDNVLVLALKLVSRGACEYMPVRDWVTCLPEVLLSYFTFLILCISNIFDLKASFQVVAKSQSFGCWPRLSHYPCTSLVNLIAVMVEGRELEHQAPVWHHAVKGLEICWAKPFAAVERCWCTLKVIFQKFLIFFSCLCKPHSWFMPPVLSQCVNSV